MANRVQENDRLKVFISYSRDDLDFADQLFAGLALCGYDPSLDRHGIAGGEDWKTRLGGLIREADSVAFILSPTSATSPVCAWEVDEAVRLGKRILPVVCRPLEGTTPPTRLGSLNYIHFYHDEKSPGTGWGAGLARLAEALNTDVDWLREHTRLLERATEWENAGRVENRMLSGDQIALAKGWAARRPKSAPEPTALHLDFIRASEGAETLRLSTEVQRLADMAAAQEARAKALADAEAAQKASARAQRFITWGSVGAALVLAAVAGSTVVQWRSAVSARQMAEAETERAEDQKEHATNILRSATAFIGRMLEAKKVDASDSEHLVQVLERGAAFGDTGAMVGLGWLYDNGQGVTQDHAKAHAWYEKAAAKDNTKAMVGLGLLYFDGRGVGQDYAMARQWYEKAAARDEPIAMRNLGLLYKNGQGVPQDNVKAREWWEKAAAMNHAGAMVGLGLLYDNGEGVAQDYAKAREWYEKASARGNETAKGKLARLPIHEAASEGRYADALRLQEALAEKTEADETARDGKPGKETGRQIHGVSWHALVARDFPKALAACDRALSLDPDNALHVNTNRAHAFVFLGRLDEARTLYLEHMGKKMSASDHQLWDTVIADDFAKLRKAGLDHPLMAEIEAAFKTLAAPPTETSATAPETAGATTTPP